MRRILLSLPALLITGACTDQRSEPAPEPTRAELLQFEYQAARADSVDWASINRKLIDGDITIEEVDLGTGNWCTYSAQKTPTAAQVNADLPTLEQTRAPYLSAFGNPRNMQFNFLITGYQARNTAPPCGGPETTLQGLDLSGNEGAASGAWRTGVSVVAAARPEMGEGWLGPALEYVNEADDQPLYFEHAVQSVSPRGYVQGEFRFMLLSRDGRYVVLARNGRFGMTSTR